MEYLSILSGRYYCVLSNLERTYSKAQGCFERLRRANLKLGAQKCNLAAREVSFLGYKVTPEGLEPEPKLMEVISKLPPPINVAEVRSFLGLVRIL